MYLLTYLLTALQGRLLFAESERLGLGDDIMKTL